ncbi:MAG: WbqC family protein [Thermodesulfobacteriota bacterium]|nr:WbqC family protein [Thermodesulfobacteriota bacterium]
MIVTIHQPDFLPWLGFFDRWKRSDFFIVLDDVQFLRRGWHHRDRIKTASGVQWLTVPVRKKGKYAQTIREVLIDNNRDWRKKHLRTIESAYRSAPNFERVFLALERVYAGENKRLIDLNMELLRFCARRMGIAVPTAFSSQWTVSGTGTRRLVELVAARGGDVYLTGLGSRDYLERGPFSDAGIKVAWQEFDHPVYPQLHGAFEKGLSVLDYLMNVQDKEAWN